MSTPGNQPASVTAFLPNTLTAMPFSRRLRTTIIINRESPNAGDKTTATREAGCKGRMVIPFRAAFGDQDHHLPYDAHELLKNIG
jgi:hypothetical protein